MRPTHVLVVFVSLSAMAGCATDEFIETYTDVALAPHDPTPEQMMDDIKRASRGAVRRVDTTDFRALK